MQAVTVKTKAIVTRAVPYRESDMIVTLVGVEEGKITATARGCLKRGAKLRYAAEPFNFGEYLLSGKEGRYVITECSQIESFSAITADIDRYYVGCLILESLDRLSREPQPRIFTSALLKLGELAYDSDRSASQIFTDFERDVLTELGTHLDFEHCNICKCTIDDEAYFSDRDGIVCKHCKSIDNIPIDALTRAYLCGSAGTSGIAAKANVLLANLIYQTSGVKIDSRYFMEQL